MITDPRLKAMASARLKHNEAINDIRFTDGQFSYNASVIKANELYKYYVSIGDMNAAMKIMNLLRRLLNRLRGVPYMKKQEEATIQIDAYILGESGFIIMTEDNNAIIQ